MRADMLNTAYANVTKARGKLMEPKMSVVYRHADSKTSTQILCVCAYRAPRNVMLFGIRFPHFDGKFGTWGKWSGSASVAHLLDFLLHAADEKNGRRIRVICCIYKIQINKHFRLNFNIAITVMKVKLIDSFKLF